MSTKTTGYEQSHMRTHATGERDPVAKHNLDEGTAREPMYKSQYAYDGVREQIPADHDDGMGAVTGER